MQRRTKSKFPWGPVLIGVGAYLFYRKSVSQPPGVTTPGGLPVSTGTSTSLAPSANYQLVHQWAVNENNAGALQWAESAPAADIDTMAKVVNVWTQYGYCPSSDCKQAWAYIKTKYPTVFAYKTNQPI